MRVGRLVLVVASVATTIVFTASPAPAAPSLPPGFGLEPVFGGAAVLDGPTAIRFAADGRVFVAEQRGVVKAFDGIYDLTPDVVIDIRSQVHAFWDRGFLGLALHPDFPSTPYLYGLYTWDDRGWGSGCPNPPGATDDGCVADGRLSRWTVDAVNTAGPEVVLIEGRWCQQYPSHSIADLAFGPDGMLHVGAGDGASFTFADFGQGGGDPGSPTPANPCGDPPVSVGGTQSPPSAEGGALRSQDLLTAGDPVSYDGTILRVDPITGYPVPSNPLWEQGTPASAQPAEARIVAHGLRNPFRMTFRPSSSELWIGDVGWGEWEELNRIQDPSDGVIENFGWPCYEGAGRQGGYDALDLTLCESLYGSGSVTAPHWAYPHGSPPGAPARCDGGGDSITGLAFVDDTSYPTSWNGALLIGDNSNQCTWIMYPDGSGVPNPSTTEVVIDDLGVVAIEAGPGGEAYVVDLQGDTIYRLTHPGGNGAPLAQLIADRSEGTVPFSVEFSASGSSDPEQDHLQFAWDLDDDGAFDDGAAPIATKTFTDTGDHVVRVRVTDFHGAEDVQSITISANPVITNEPPTLDPIDDVASAEGELVTVTPAASDPDLPSQTLTFSIASGPGSIDPSSGLYTWTPGEDDDGDNPVTIRVTDSGTPPLFDEETFTIDVAEVNAPPAVSIDGISAASWIVGDEISVAGSATDAEDGELTGAALQWDVYIQHCETPTSCHTHSVASFSGSSGSFFAPDHEFETWLTIELEATDSTGATSRASVDLHPRTVELTFTTAPAGLQLAVNGAGATSPVTVEAIEGSLNQASAITPQDSVGHSWVFSSWLHGPATATIEVTAQGADAVFTALYEAVPSVSVINDIAVAAGDLVAFAVKATDPDGPSLTYSVVSGPGTIDSSSGVYTWTPAREDVGSHVVRIAVSDGTHVQERSFTVNVFEVLGGGVVPDAVGLVDPAQGLWHLHDTTGLAGAALGDLLAQFFYGNPGDFPVMGDWDCDGVDTPGMYRQSDGFVYLRNSNSQGIADIRFFFGNPGDVPIVGDFDGDGCDTVSIFRPAEGRVFIINELGQDDGGLGAAELDYYFGNPGDKPFVGDFDGDGIDTVGLHRESTGFVYFRNSHTQGFADDSFFFGDPGDRFVAGDWIGDGADTPGLYRPSDATFYFRFTNTQGSADATLTVGEPTFVPVAGVFDL